MFHSVLTRSWCGSEFPYSQYWTIPDHSSSEKLDEINAR